MAWLHDPDTLRTLSEEGGAIGEWACLHRAVRRLPGALPTRPLYRGVVAVLRPPEVMDWFTAQLEVEGFICVLEHAVAHGVIPEDRMTWIEACRSGLNGPHAESCADTLLRLSHPLSPADLAHASMAAPQSATLPAWIASVDAASVEEVAAGVDVVPSIRLLLPTAPPQGDAPLEEGCAAVGLPVPASGKGSSRRRLARQLLALAEHLEGPLAALVCGLARSSSPIPADVAHGVALVAGAGRRDPMARYAVGLFDPDTLAACRRADVEPLEGSVGIERGQLPALPPSSIYGQQALAARCPEWVPLLLSEAETRDVGLELARFTPTEEVLELLFACSMPQALQARLDLAIALIHSGVATVMPRVRELAEKLEEGNQAFLHNEALSFFREGL